MIVGESKLKDIYRILVWGAGQRLSPLLPEPSEARIFRGIGRLSSHMMVSKKKQIMNNISRAFPNRKDIECIAESAFAAHFANQYVSFSIPKIKLDNCHRYLRWEGLESLKKSLQSGGAVLAHPHMGPAQLPLHALGLSLPSVHQIGGGEIHLVERSPVGQWASETRGRLEQQISATLHDGKSYLRPALRALKNGAVVLTACDATGGGKEIGRRFPTTLLGHSFELPIGHIWFAWRAQVPMFPLYCVRDPLKKSLYLAVVGKPISFYDLDREAAIEKGINWTRDFLNEALTKYPGSWLFWDGFSEGGLLS